MSTEKRSFIDSLGIMAKTYSLNGIMVGHGGYSEVARQHVEQVQKEAAKQKEQKEQKELDEFSPYNTVNS